MGVLRFLGGVVGWAAAQSGLLGFLPHTVQVGVTAVAGILTALGIRDAAKQPSVALVDWLNKLGSGWKTLAGAIIWAVGALLAPDVFGTLSPAVAKIVAVAGQVLTALGLYHATAKVTTGK